MLVLFTNKDRALPGMRDKTARSCGACLSKMWKIPGKEKDIKMKI